MVICRMLEVVIGMEERRGGSNAEIVIADAFAKGMKGIDYELALKAMIKDAEVPPTDDDGLFGKCA